VRENSINFEGKKNVGIDASKGIQTGAIQEKRKSIEESTAKRKPLRNQTLNIRIRKKRGWGGFAHFP